MPAIVPFKGTYFNRSKIADLSRVVTQPYDRIDAKLKDDYLARDPHNIVRVDFGKDEPGDGEAANRYTRARTLLDQWLKDEVIVTDRAPAIYPYFQTYQTPAGPKTRRGLIAAVRLEEFGKGTIHPHEQTHAKPKEDRLKLLKAVRAHLSHVFMLYGDPQKTLGDVFEEVARTHPMLEATDDFGEWHRVWKIDDPKVVRRIQKDLERRDAIIADGHHRYETALAYKQETKAKTGSPEDFVLATLFNMDDEGLTIYPTHRIVSDLPSFDAGRMLKALSKWFDVRDYTFDAESESYARQEFVEDVRIEGMSKTCFGVVVRDEDSYTLLNLSRPEGLEKLQDVKRPPEWRRLDVNILHDVILRGQLGVTPDDVKNERFVRYARHAEEVVDAVRKHRTAQVGFFVNPVKIDQVRAIVKLGERFPQKTTDFYPKLLTGLMSYRLDGGL